MGKAFSYRLSGVVTDTNRIPIPYVAVYINKSTYGVSSNIKGEYYLELQNGNYEIVFYSLGYEKKVVPVTIQNKNEVVNITLAASVSELAEVVVTEGKEDPAYAIIRKAIKAKDKYRSIANEYTCKVYLKSSLEKEYLKKTPIDSVTKSKTENELTKERMNFIESYSTLYVHSHNTIKEVKEAYKDLAETFSNNMTIYAYRDPDKPEHEPVNLNLFKTKISDANFNFYNNLVDVPSLSSSPLVSPLSSITFLSYKFRLEESLYEDSVWVNKIKVIPRRKDASLFNGYIYIVDSAWCIKSVDLEVDPATLNHFKFFRIFQKYTNLKNNIWALSHEEFFYDSKEGKETIIGNTFIKYSDYNLSPSIPANFFKNELSVIEDNAYDKDSTYWKQIRPVTLKEDELKFINKIDSVENYRKSDKYLHEQDSVKNRIKWIGVLWGFSLENSSKKQHIHIRGMVNNLISGMFGIGGYRQHFLMAVNKEFSKGYQLNTEGVLDYGFTNRDLKGHIETSYTYLPKHFGRVHGGYRNEYGFINSYQAVSTILSMSNYVNNIGYVLGNEIEIFNGAYIDLAGEYVRKQAIDKLIYSRWSEQLFGKNNEGEAFQNFDKLALDITLKYTPAQKYFTEPYKKINLGSKYPTFAFNYRKGIPDFMNSTANYDFVEIRVWDNMKFGSFGESKWKIYTGKFLNSTSLRFTENKFFRMSDRFLFSDPLRSFQLLDTALSTTNEYFQAHYIHRLNGKLLNKIPFIKKLHLMEVGGAGILLINQNNFRHAEVYGGIEKPFNFNKAKFRFKIGCYYIVSNSNYSKISGTLKIGIDFFDLLTSSWGY